jgi:hypothetical protein
MSYYTHHTHTDAGHYVHIDVTLHHSGDLVPPHTQHTNDPRHIRFDVHSEDSVKKKKKSILVKMTNIKFHYNLSVGKLDTPHGKTK